MIMNLPTDMLCTIIEFLWPYEKYVLANVSKKLYEAVYAVIKYNNELFVLGYDPRYDHSSLDVTDKVIFMHKIGNKSQLVNLYVVIPPIARQLENSYLYSYEKFHAENNSICTEFIFQEIRIFNSHMFMTCSFIDVEIKHVKTFDGFIDHENKVHGIADIFYDYTTKILAIAHGTKVKFMTDITTVSLSPENGVHFRDANGYENKVINFRNIKIVNIINNINCSCWVDATNGNLMLYNKYSEEIMSIIPCKSITKL